MWSHERFGTAVRDGYEELITAAILDLAQAPTRVGVRARPELGEAVLSWHLAQSRDHVRSDARRIKSPRHFILFRAADNVVTILRVLHDRMNPSEHSVS